MPSHALPDNHLPFSRHVRALSLQGAFRVSCTESCCAGQRQSASMLSEGCPWYLQGSPARLYDAVLVAVPLELANITISGVKHKVLPLRSYQRTVTTLVSGRLSPSYFGVEELPKGARQPPVSQINPAMHLVCNPTPVSSWVGRSC
jgi:hypothetical protein